ncbi:hypothetical protein [Cyclobacterium jeungdonense]|uniref:Uncharacterized protein n=1 Tax=Cyclobacterium jeungdonense TaxID=708087 RepID=A0ABT8C1B8_9BACT|nr:hypothetical protein [Cyclobacterium jeungdonense]MDN3686588.1 hypothetical protein [Cyclobacterium jeungdonense]
MIEKAERLKSLKKDFRLLERNVLLLIAIPLPFFSFAYLYSTSSTLSLDLPELPSFLNYVTLSLVTALLVMQQVGFQKRISKVKNSDADLGIRIKSYASATFLRYWQLFWVGILTSFGLFFYNNQGFTIMYAINLLFVSLGKPTPHRIVTSLHLKKEEKDLVYEINKRDD